MIQSPLLYGHERKWMDLPVIRKLEGNDLICHDGGLFFLTFQRKSSIEGLVFSSLAKRDFLTGI
jgi:hypothetical protein